MRASRAAATTIFRYAVAEYRALLPSKLLAAVTAWISPVKCKLNCRHGHEDQDTQDNQQLTYLIHGYYLTITASSSSSLNTESGSLTRLTNASKSRST